MVRFSFDRVDLKVSSDWKRIDIVLDVPHDAETITFGYSLYGNGVIAAYGLMLETVGSEVPVTKQQ